MQVQTLVPHTVTLDERAVEAVFHARLDSLCGGPDVYLNDKTGEVEEWENTGHGSGITRVEDKKPSKLKLAALNLRQLLKDKERNDRKRT